jgi:hypothetical protein
LGKKRLHSRREIPILMKAYLQGWPLADIWEEFFRRVPTIPRIEKARQLCQNYLSKKYALC